MDLKGTIKIRKGNENQKPAVVFITGKNKFDWWVSEALNTGNTLFGEDDDFIDFDFKTFNVMLYEWEIENNERKAKRLKELLIKAKDGN